LVIVPFGAFRSLAAEQEDETFGLLSITALGPRQIIRGKLGSSVLQMLIYLSAVSPCVAFTYMLRGIDVPTILVTLAYLVLYSFGLSVIGLCVGTLTTQKHLQSVLSVLWTGGLLFAFGTSFWLIFGMLEFGRSIYAEPEFWTTNAAIVTGYASYVVLFFYAAVARITFASDNRSSRLRATMLAQQAIFTGWMAWVWISLAEGDDEVLFLYVVLAVVHWWLMGALMIGESPEISSRVKRSLPQSFLGRAFLTWFNPGPGTGYLLAVSSLCGTLAIVAIALGLADVLDWSPRRGRAYVTSEVLAFTAIAICYPTVYLGVGLLAVRAIRRFYNVTVELSVLIQVLLVLAGVLFPVTIESLWLRQGYTLLQCCNPFWTLAELADGNLPETGVLLVVLPLLSMLVLRLNLPGVAREVRHVRIAAPQRVAAEDAEIEAVRHPRPPAKTSPWD
jgi:hypothetical protein